MRCMLLHLLLAGGLLAAEPVLVAFGENVDSAEPGRMVMAIAEGYAKAHGLTPTEHEIAPLRAKTGPKPRVREMDFAYLAVFWQKLNRVWWAKHGGRLVLSAFGTHLAADAMLMEVEQMEKAGEVKFLQAGVRERFFKNYREYRGDGVVSGTKAREVLAENYAK